MLSYDTPAFRARFWSKVDRGGPVPAHCPELGPCWLWTGAKISTGYGETWDGKHILLAHRASWELENGASLSDGLFVCHHCDVRLCVNPAHLFAGTHSDNMRDMLSKGRGIKPEQRARGDRNGRRLHPERYWRVRPAPMPGEKNHRAKLTDERVLSIRQRYAAGGVTQDELALENGVSRVKIGQIVRGECWKHLL